jgi:hypothetical protein
MGKDLYIKYLDVSPKVKDQYERLKRSLMEKIVTNRIYQTDQLRRLYEDTVAKNRLMDPRRLKTIWDEIMNDLNA